MAALNIRTDILAPEHKKILNFTGHNPKRFLKIIVSFRSGPVETITIGKPHKSSKRAI